MRCQDHQNDNATTPPMPENTAKRPKLLSSVGNESPSLPVLPEELILGILLRVPVRSLLRFRCVCKSWKTLISDPQFAKDHLRTSTADPNMTHQRLLSPIAFNPFKIVSFTAQSLFQNPSTPAKARCFRMRRWNQLLGSCDGLLCMFDVYKGGVRLWNPSTRLKSKRLSISGSSNVLITYRGFGYDHVNDKYKLLVVLEDLGQSQTVTKICTFGANSWTVLQNFPCQPTGWPGRFVSGTLNWIAKRGASDDQWVILSLDLGTETYGEVLLPNGDGHKICNPVLGVLHNCLSVCFFDSEKAHWAVWLMKEYGVQESWTKLTTIPHVVEDIETELVMIPEDQRGICKWNHSLDPLCISEDGVVLVRANSSKLVLYNSNDGYDRFDDEDMFESLLTKAYGETSSLALEIFACIVGPSKARYYLDETVDVMRLL
ncbi:F-box/kelch-repeat protein [Spatholobus suberectus]|nr:F-box/kelch-repeat protein [Spatholobus suberectus]